MMEQTSQSSTNSTSTTTTGRKLNLPGFNHSHPPCSSKDPLKTLMEIAQARDIDPEIRDWLFNYSVTRFKNRRRMAFIALTTIIGIIAFLGFGAIYDGTSTCVDSGQCQGILASLEKIESLMVWAVGFLASIVATYYGVSSFRPSS